MLACPLTRSQGYFFNHMLILVQTDNALMGIINIATGPYCLKCSLVENTPIHDIP
jgi:hypothetical protein